MKEVITKNVEERNALIEKLYKEGIKYAYTDADRDGNYHVNYDADTEVKIS